jgi:hypothetical protein
LKWGKPGEVIDVSNCLLSGGKLLLELNRLLRPGGYFVWSATPVYQKLPEDVEIWNGIVLNAFFNFTRTVIQKVIAIPMTTYRNRDILFPSGL